MAMFKFKWNATKIQVAANQMYPFIYANYIPSTSILLSLDAYEGKLLGVLSEVMQFEFELVDCKMQWGNKLANGSWTGLVGALLDKQAQLAIGGLSITSERAEVVSYSYPHYINSVSFTAPLPQRQHYSGSSVLDPFEQKIWLTLLIFICLMIFLDLILRHTWSDINPKSINWSIISLLLSQPITSFDSLSLRALTVGWLLSALILKNYYSAEIFRLMSSIDELDPIDTIEEYSRVIRAGQLKVLTYGKNSIYMPRIKNLDLTSNEAKKYLKEVKRMQDIAPVLKKEPGQYSVVMERMALQYYINLYDIQQILPPTHKDSNFFLDYQGLAFQKGSELEYHVNKWLSVIKSSGFIDHWISEFYITTIDKLKNKNATEEVDKRDEDFKSLRFKQMHYVFNTILGAVCVSFVLFSIELINWTLNYKLVNERQNDSSDNGFVKSYAKLVIIRRKDR